MNEVITPTGRDPLPARQRPSVSAASSSPTGSATKTPDLAAAILPLAPGRDRGTAPSVEIAQGAPDAIGPAAAGLRVQRRKRHA